VGKTKKVYVPMAVDILHAGHINIINHARKLGDVIIGLLSDKAIMRYKRLPLIELEKRKLIVENIKGVKSIIIQDQYDYEPILREIKPDYVVHGDDWKTGKQSFMRKKVIKVLKDWGGELVEPKYTKGISSSALSDEITKNGITTDARRKLLRRMLTTNKTLKFLEAHNGLTGIIVEKTNIEKNGRNIEFDGIWESSLTDSAAKGKPDTELVDFTSRFSTIEEILEVTTKPIIVDGDTGGRVEHFKFRIKTLERLGVSAIIIEDKIGDKRNSLFGTSVPQQQDSIDNFSQKISQGKKSQITDDFMIIARIESLILGKSVDHAIDRASSYIKAGADGIMIHSKKKDGNQIIEFCKKYKKLNEKVHLVVVPSTYSHMTERELQDLGVNIIIYANHLIRSAYPAMVNAAESILKNSRSKEASEKFCMPIKEIINLIPEDN
tara:strand:- start:32887 stop:34197 length:1311 start_codon:yes stop_codon:yes gene_type:complete